MHYLNSLSRYRHSIRFFVMSQFKCSNIIMKVFEPVIIQEVNRREHTCIVSKLHCLQCLLYR